MPIFYVNGKYVNDDEAVINVRDLAVLRGFGAFDFMKTYGQKPFRIEKNLQRLRNSCSILGINYPWTDEDVKNIVITTLNKNLEIDCNPKQEYALRLVVSGGVCPSDLVPDDNTQSTLMVICKHYGGEGTVHKTGVKIISVDINRLFPNAKSTLYTPAIMGHRRARAQGAYEALYVENGNALECTTCNVFAIYKENNSTVLHTPRIEDGILPGITRMTVLELAEKYAIENKDFVVKVEPLSLEKLKAADEAFVTSAGREILWLNAVDDACIGEGIGAHTELLVKLFKKLTTEPENW